MILTTYITISTTWCMLCAGFTLLFHHLLGALDWKYNYKLLRKYPEDEDQNELDGVCVCIMLFKLMFYYFKACFSFPFHFLCPKNVRYNRGNSFCKINFSAKGEKFNLITYCSYQCVLCSLLVVPFENIKNELFSTPCADNVYILNVIGIFWVWYINKHV